MNLPARRDAIDLREVVEVLGPGALEVRDPRGATRRVGWSSPTLPQVEEWDATQAFRFGYAANVIAYRCVQLRANAIASVPIVAGRKMGDATTINEQAPLARLLGPPPGGPAPKLSARKLIRWTIAQEIVTGRRAWEIETADGSDRVVALWPLAIANLKAYPSKGGSEWFRVFEYGHGAEAVRFQPDQIFYSWDPAGTDFRKAESELQAARFDLSLVNLCDRYGIGFLRNNAVPAAIVTTTAFPSEAAKRAFERQWAAEFGGPDNAGRVYVHEVGDDGDGPVGDSIDVKVLGLSAKDARLVEQRKDAMLEVAIALGTPWSKLDASGRTYDNAEVEDRAWWETTLLPDLVDLQDDINMQLAPRLGSEVCWFDLRAVPALARRVKPITQEVGAPALLFARIMKINEARADYGLELLPDGDRFLTDDEVATLQGWGVSGSSDVEAMRSALAELEQRMPPASEDRAEEPKICVCKSYTGTEDGRCETCGGKASAPAPESRIVDPEQLEQRRARIWRTADAVATAIEARWIRAMRRLFAKQEKAAVDRLTGKRGRQMLAELRAEPLPDPAPQIDPSSIFDPDFWRSVTAELVTDLLEDAAGNGLQRLTAQFDVAFDLTARWVQDFIEARAQQLAGHVTQTTYDAIRAALVDGVTAGDGVDQLADRIRKVFAQASEQRAETIARTEVISAYNGAATLGASTLPADVVAGQEWIATRDARTRESHAAADGQIVPIGEPFTVSGANAAYPGDPALPPGLSVNCRCTVAFLTPEEMAELTERAPKRSIPMRSALALLSLLPAGEPFTHEWRRAAEDLTEIAA